MAKRSTSSLSLITEAWTFFRKQRALGAVTVWFFALPTWLIGLLTRLTDQDDIFGGTALHRFLAQNDPKNLIAIFLSLVLTLVSVWGAACVLVVGRRMIKSKAGRARTSFRAVRQDAAPLVGPLFLTALLRACFALYWSLLVLVPGALLFINERCRTVVAFVLQSLLFPAEIAALLADTPAGVMDAAARAVARCPLALLLPILAVPMLLYLVRTSFYAVVLVAEGKRYRAALQRSKDVVRRQLGRTVLAIVLLTVVLWAPAGAAGILLEAAASAVDPRLLPFSDLLGALVQSVSAALTVLSLVALYGRLRDGKAQEVLPPD